jgi:hypothetical protein
MSIKTYLAEKIGDYRKRQEEQREKHKKIDEERKKFIEELNKKAFEKRKAGFRRAYIKEAKRAAVNQGKEFAKQRFAPKVQKPLNIPDIDEINNQLWGNPRKRPERKRVNINSFDIGID